MNRLRWAAGLIAVAVCAYGPTGCGGASSSDSGDGGATEAPGGEAGAGHDGGPGGGTGSGGDAGNARQDSGATTSGDSGAGASDSGSEATDGGSKPVDSGTAPVDSGARPTDSGTAPVDSGTKPVDSGAAPVDSGSSTACGAGDPNMPAEPTIPPACATLTATQNVAANGVPSESKLDTATIQAALTACPSGQAVKLVPSGANNSFVTGPIKVPTGVTLWVDAGATLFGTRDPNVYGSATALISVGGSHSGIVGDGVIDGQGGEPVIGGTQSWWDMNANSGGNSPALISVQGATNFTLYRITLHNSPKFHVKLSANGFVVWGVTVKTPSKTTNSAGTALTPSSAHNTDGIDPGESASNGFIVCSLISDGDDHIAIKGSSATGVTNLVIAHNHFEAGHGMSIGSEFTGGVSGINVYDLSIDGTGTGLGGGSSNGIRIKSDSSRGGLVNDVTYSDVCTRAIANPILLTPTYSTATGSDIPQYTNITIRNFHSLATTVTPNVTLDGYSASVMNSITLDNVVVDGVAAANVTASNTKVTLGPGNVNFTPSGSGVTVTNSISGTSTPNACTGKWVTF